MLKGYPITVLDEVTGQPVQDKYLNENNETKIIKAIITSGQQIGTALDSYYPYRDSSDLEDKKMWKFVGYKRMIGGAVLNISTIVVNEPLTLYAAFEEDDVINNPLTSNEILVTRTDGGYYEVDVLPGCRGKICIPR
jgi:hypothetical protein